MLRPKTILVDHHLEFDRRRVQTFRGETGNSYLWLAATAHQQRKQERLYQVGGSDSNTKPG